MRNDMMSGDISMFVIFGRPGAGKSTTADKVVHLLNDKGYRSATGSIRQQCGDDIMKHHEYLAVDLDVCVSQTMRDNFVKGKYPTLKERAVFIQEAIQYVTNEIQTAQQNTKHNKLIVIISFSFVNTDLRTAFRDVFPNNAYWILVDTSDDLAIERISKREGHFYKNTNNVKEVEDDAITNVKDNDNDNSEWNFQPVTFPHMILDGRQDVEVNARQITEYIEKHT